MKKTALLFLALLAIGNKVFAQACALLNPTIDVLSTTSGVNGCTFTVNFSFEIDNNNGNKWQFVHLGNSTNYPGLTYANTPDSVTLANSLINIVIDNKGANPVLSTTYPYDTRVKVVNSTNSPGVALYEFPGTTANSDGYIIKNIRFTVPGGCNQAIQLNGDSWSSQAATGQVVHCQSPTFQLHINDPFVSGYCAAPQPNPAYNFTMSTKRSSISVYYTTYMDDGDGVFEENGDFAMVTVTSANAFTITPTTPFNSGNVAYPAPYNGAAYTGRKVYVLARVVGQTDRVVTEIDPCPAVPLHDYGDLPTSGGVISWPNSKAQVVGSYNVAKMRIDSTVTENTSAVWAGYKVGLRATGFTACTNGATPVTLCDSNDDGLEMPTTYYGQDYNYVVRVNSNIIGQVVYYGLWIDFNNDGNFTNDVDRLNSQAFYSGFGITGTSNNVAIPVKVPNGTSSSVFKTRLITSANPVTSTMSSATNIVNGEIEDFNAAINVPLPITYSGFSVSMSNCQGAIRFKTEIEENTDYHNLERSTDGSNWTTIATAKSKGSHGGVYSFTDEAPAEGMNFYRMKSVDLDRTFSYTTTASGYKTCGAGAAVSVFPNPVKNTLTISVNGAPASVVTVTDLLGNRVMQSNLSENETTVDVSRLPIGTYMVCVTYGADQHFYKTIVKQ